MKNLEKSFPIICAFLLVLLFSACGEKGKTVSNDVNVSDISASVSEALGDNDAFVSVPESYISDLMKMNASNYDSYDVKINSKGINIDEYGIFKAKDSSQTSDIEKTLEDYLKLRISTWMPEYMPEEFPKLKNAEIKIVGNYVMYAILSDSGKKTAFEIFEKSLTA